MSFSLDAYVELIGRLRCGERPFRLMSEYMADPDGAPCILLRHDVDRLPGRSIKIAQAEADLGIQSVYYFRCSPDGVFPANAIEQIVGLGHEAGYHYECLSRCGGDLERALTQFRDNLDNFRNISPCKTVSMHGKPLSQHNNLDLLKGVNLKEYDIVGDAVLFFQHRTPVYITDTGGAWTGGINLRDHIGRYAGEYPELDDDSICKWLRNSDLVLYVSTHPERWPATKLSVLQSSIQDYLINIVKRFIEFTRWFS